MKFHHTGVICNNVAKEKENIKKYHKVIYESEIVFDELQGVELCYLKLDEGMSLELISGEKVENLMHKGTSYYHICYEVKDIYSEIENLKTQGAIVVAEPVPAKLFEMRKVAFLFLSYGLVELLEEEKR